MENKVKVILSVDAGGTSTRYAIINSKKKILYQRKGTPGSPAVNINACLDMYNMISEICKTTKDIYDINLIVLGISGFALVDKVEFTNKIKTTLNIDVILESDVSLALQSILKDKEENGAVVVSGTGAMVLAINNNTTFSTSGFGQLLTERGSAYTCVKDFVCKMIRDMEEKGYLDEFEIKFMKYMNYEKLEDFKDLFYRHLKDEIASYSIFFKDEANKKNVDAINWLYHMGELLGLDTLNAIRRVNMDKTFILGIKGGFACCSSYIKNGIIDTLNKNGYNPTLVQGNTEPIIGGYYLAKKLGYI